MEDPSDKIGDKSIVIKVSKLSPNPGVISLRDIRMNKPLGVISRKDGYSLFLQRTMEFSFEEKVGVVVAPNQIALCLSSYKRNHNLAVKLWRRIAEKIEKKSMFYGREVKPIYDFVEYMEAAIISLYRAIETFANLSIPERFQYERSKGHGVTETFTKEGIERRISTSEKIREILPKVLNVESPAKEPFWKGFLEFEELRNEVIHPKTGNFVNLANSFFQNRCLEITNDAVSLLSYFIKKEPGNRLFPLGFSDSVVSMIETEDVSKMYEKLGGET